MRPSAARFRASTLALTAIQLAYSASLRPAALRFRRALARPEAAQQRRLLNLVRDGEATSYGDAHRFRDVHSVAEYQDRVPIVSYDDLEPWCARVARGEANVLTKDPVRAVERSSGSTSKNKLIPYTDQLLADFSAATHPWLADLFDRCPGLYGTTAYWAISPVTRQRETTEGGIPVGFDDDTAYFNPVLGWALQKTLAVPSSVARQASIEAWRRETAVHLLSNADLGLFSVWSPTFLTLLMQYIDANLGTLLEQVPSVRRQTIRSALDRRGAAVGEALWPRLALISCWMDGPSVDFVARLRTWFPNTPLQPKGLLATEGVVSIPLVGATGGVLAVASHFLEFIDLDCPGERPLLAHQLRADGTYSPVLSTGGGLYRYHLKDVVRCVGMHHATPTVRFLGKLDCVSDLFGEKMNARCVEQALSTARKETGVSWRFGMVAPIVGGTPCYCLFAETDSDEDALGRVVAIVERALCESHHYAYCRTLGQLAPLRAMRIKDGLATYEKMLNREGVRVGDMKLTCLDRRTCWAEAFASDAASATNGDVEAPLFGGRS